GVAVDLVELPLVVPLRLAEGLETLLLRAERVLLVVLVGGDAGVEGDARRLALLVTHGVRLLPRSAAPRRRHGAPRGSCPGARRSGPSEPGHGRPRGGDLPGGRRPGAAEGRAARRRGPTSRDRRRRPRAKGT